MNKYQRKHKRDKQKLLQFFNNGKPYETSENLTIKRTAWGVDFELHCFNWLSDKVSFDHKTGYWQNRILDGLYNIPSWRVRTEDVEKCLWKNAKVEGIFSTGDDFEIDSTHSLTIYGIYDSTHEDLLDSEYLLIEKYQGDFILVKNDSDAINLHLHGAEYYCQKCADNPKCACSGDFCSIEDVANQFDFESEESLLEYVQNYQLNSERLLEHPRLFPYTDDKFKELFMGKRTINTDDFLIDEEHIYCPECLGKQKIEDSFYLYS